jgi:beta-galactosidase
MFRSTVSEQYVPYIFPQEHGHHTDVRWGAVWNGQNRGVVFSADRLVGFNASHYSVEDINAARHTTDLVERNETLLHIDYFHRGLGCASCGSDTYALYRSTPGIIKWTYALHPFTGGEEEARRIGRRLRNSLQRHADLNLE